MASPELDNRAAVVLLCVVTRQMDSSPTPLPLAVQAATTPPLLGDVAAERSILASRDDYGVQRSRAPQSKWLCLNLSGSRSLCAF
jgi:hypothetical protein